jgi:uncharacterized protein (DUF1800 family)
LNQENIHILNRFGFGPKLDWLNNPELKELLFDSYKLKQWLNQTAPEYSESTKYFSQTLKHRVEKSTDQWRKNWEYAAYRVDWIDTMVELDNPIREKAALFWNHHIPISVGIWPFAQTLLLDCYREHALGNFGDLLKAISATPCAMKFLNAYHSSKNSPNQNFPRELLEIFTLGVGNYNQKEINEIARAFTGRRTVFPDVWNLPYPYKMYIDENQFDNSNKTVFGETGNWNGEDVIDILLKQKQTATHIAKSVLKFYLTENPSEKHIQETADFYYTHNYNFLELINFLIQQPWFCNKEFTLTKVKTPIELWVQFQRQLELRALTSETTNFITREFGQSPLHPKNVGGWPNGQAWLKGNKLSNRLFLPSVMIEISKTEKNHNEKSFGEKIKNHLINRNLLGYKFDHEISFNQNNFDKILEANQISNQNWLQIKNHQSELIKLFTHPSYQFN